MKNQKGSASGVVIAVLALLLAGAIGYIVWQKTSQQKANSTQTSTASNPTISKAETEPTPDKQTVTLGQYTFEAPTSWTNFAKTTASTYAMNVQGSLPDTVTKIDVATIEVMPLADVRMDYGGGSLYEYSKAASVWNALPQKSVKDFQGVTANFVGGGLEGQYSLTAKYVRVTEKDAVVITIQESGDEGKEYSFPGTAPYKSNNLQNDIVSVLESVKN